MFLGSEGAVVCLVGGLGIGLCGCGVDYSLVRLELVRRVLSA